MRKPWIVALMATSLFVGVSIDHALAMCKQGGPNCTPLSKNHPVRVKTTVGNAGDCVGSTNETCGYTTHAMTHHSTVTYHPTTGNHSRK